MIAAVYYLHFCGKCAVQRRPIDVNIYKVGKRGIYVARSVLRPTADIKTVHINKTFSSAMCQ
jgi:hypothetical protein